MSNDENNICEFCDCNKAATHFDKELQSWLCDEHEGANCTGYCSRDCQLGYGCDGSC